MKLSVLGCSGGIGGEACRTTSFLLGDDVLIDCGTGVGDLSLAALARIDHVFLTHAHFDHIAYLPLLADSVTELRSRPVTVHGRPETLQALQQHVFNGSMWPDFTRLPSPSAPVLRLSPLDEGDSVALPGGGSITALPAFHGIPALAYAIDSGAGRLVFSGDTRFEYGFVAALNGLGRLDHLIVETAFTDEQQTLAMDSSHLHPQALSRLLDALEVSPRVHVSHLKPGLEQRILDQIAAQTGRLSAEPLRRGDVIEF